MFCICPRNQMKELTPKVVFKHTHIHNITHLPTYHISHTHTCACHLYRIFTTSLPCLYSLQVLLYNTNLIFFKYTASTFKIIFVIYICIFKDNYSIICLAQYKVKEKLNFEVQLWPKSQVFL